MYLRINFSLYMYIKVTMKQISVILRGQVSKLLVYLSDLVMACPLRESTLKLLVRVGKMRNAITVVLLLLDLR